MKPIKSLSFAVAIAVCLMAQAQNKTDSLLGDGYRADKVPSSDAGRYYMDGHASALDSIFPSSYSAHFKVGANLRAGLSNNCGDLDFYQNITAEVKNLQYKLKNTIKNAQKAIMGAASGAVSSLFQYALMKVNPTLGQLTTKQLDEYIELFNLKVKQCRDFERDVAQGKDPLGELMEIAVGERWKYTIGRVNDGSISLEEAEQEMIDDARKEGLVLADGKAYGGEGQEPINLTKSLLKSGMNLVMARGDKGSWDSDFGSDVVDNPILKEFKNAKELYEFVEEIYGATEKTLGKSKADSERVNTIAGKGYEKKYVEYRNEHYEKLKAYILENGDREAFEKETGHVIPPVEVDDVRRLPPYQRAVQIESMARMFAINRMSNNLIFAKQALKTGIYAPDLQQSAIRKPAEEEYKALYYRIMDDLREIQQRAWQY